MIDPIDLPAGAYAPFLAGFKSGNYYQCSPTITTNTSASNGINIARITPFPVPSRSTLTRIGAEVTAAGDAGSLVRLGIYADDGEGYPGDLILDAGTIAGDAVGVQEKTIDVTLEPGLYWVCAAVQNVTTTQPTLRTLSGPCYNFALTSGGATPTATSTPPFGYSGFSFTGAFPATFPTSVNVATVAPRIFVKVA